MALSLPTTSNTIGAFSNSVAAANLTLTAFTRDSKFLHANGQNEMTGVSVAISANGDYAVVGNRAQKAGTANEVKGFPYILSRSGNTWSTMTTLVVQTSANTTNNYDQYSGWNDNNWARNVAIDNDGSTVVISGRNGGSNSNAGRVEIWERSGSNWTFSNGFDGGTGDQIGVNGVVLSGDGTSLIAGGVDTIGRYTKSGSVWSQDFLNDTASGIGLGGSVDYDKAGTKFVHLNSWALGNNTSITTVKLQTSYWTGSTWANTTQTIDQTGYQASRSKALRMSGDGNYLAVHFDDNAAADGEGRMHMFVWDSSNNDWDSQAVISGKAGTNGWGTSPSLNYDGTKFVSGGNAGSNNPWIAFKRSGSTWSQEKQTNWPQSSMTGYGITELSNDGMHLLLAAPQTYHDSSSYGNGGTQKGMVEYWVPTGIAASAVVDGSTHTHQGRRFRYNSAKGSWRPATAASLDGVSTTRTRSSGIENTSLAANNNLNIDGVTVSVDAFAGRTETYANASIFPFSSLTSGDQAIAEDTGYLYVTNGAGWYKVANSQPV
jgi:hypothetical protein